MTILKPTSIILSLVADNHLILKFDILGKNLVSKSPNEMET